MFKCVDLIKCTNPVHILSSYCNDEKHKIKLSRTVTFLFENINDLKFERKTHLRDKGQSENEPIVTMCVCVCVFQRSSSYPVY